MRRFPLDQELPEREPPALTKAGHRIKAGTAEIIGRATLISMLGMFLAKLTGFLREILIVPKFGYGLYSDAYINAFQIPDLFYELLIGGVVAAVITPTLSSGIERDDEAQVWQGVNVFISLAMLAMLALILIGQLLAPFLMALITGSGAKEASEALKDMAHLAVPVTRILFFQSFFMMLIALFGGVLSAYKRFTPLAVGPSLYNIAYMIALLALGAPTPTGIRQVAIGVVMASLLYALYQIFSARRELHFFRLSLRWQHPGFQRLLRLAVPTLISGSVLHLNSIIMNRFANGLDIAGAVTSVRQCNTTWALPYAVFAASVGIVMLPNLAGFYAQDDVKKIRQLYTSSLRQALYNVIPFALIFALMSEETIQAIFQWNVEAYGMADVQQTALILRWFCISMVAQTVVFITNQAFYARRVTKMALFIGFMALFFNPIFSSYFVHHLGKGVEGIGMAHASYSVLTALALFFLYRWQKPAYRPFRLLPYVLQLLVVTGLAGFVLVSLQRLPLRFDAKILQLLFYGSKVLICLLTYYLAGLSLGFREAVQLQAQIRQFLQR